uniref:Putative c-type lectin n=1 Tax=Lutzomyia longipalpis TaxID=7200 RepID=A0A1B0CKD2_LUTLO
MNLKGVFICVLVVLVQSVLAQRYPHPVCAPQFQYVHLNSKLGWVGFGSTTFLDSSSLHNITLEVIYATVELENYSNLGELEITHFHQLRTLKTNVRQWNVLYVVKFSTQNPIPDVIKTVLNGVVLCDDKVRASSSQKPVHVRLLLTYNDFLKEQKFTAKVINRFPTGISSSDISSFNIEGVVPRQLTGRKVFISKMPLSWFDGQSFCKKNGFTLTSIKSENEDNELNQALKDVLAEDIHWVWVGGNSFSGEWRWIGDGSLVDYSNWDVKDGEPNNYNNNEHCMHLRVRWIEDKWNDNDCANIFHFV